MHVFHRSQHMFMYNRVAPLHVFYVFLRPSSGMSIKTILYRKI